MLRRSLLFAAVLAALALVPAAVADGGGPGIGVVEGDGVTNAAGTLRYVAVAAGTNTVVEAVRTNGGQVEGSNLLAGQFGIPLVTIDGGLGGLSADGHTLVLGDAVPGSPLRTVSHFAVVDPGNLQQAPEVFELRGDFSFDALSPSGRVLYLIQHVSAQDFTRYVVRAYDLRDQRLLPRRIADRTQRSWVMQGYAATRTAGPGGRFVYTLYQNPGGTPFVHALDTVSMTARCIGIPWHGPNQDALWNLRLAVRDGGKSLALDWRSGRPYVAIDTRTYRISYPHSSFPWLPAAGGAAGAVLLAAAAGLLYLRRRRRIVVPDDAGSIEALERIPVLTGIAPDE
jgi:hypothetical protein